MSLEKKTLKKFVFRWLQQFWIVLLDQLNLFAQDRIFSVDLHGHEFIEPIANS